MMMPNADAIALGKQIKAVRKAMGMTQDQLALKSHVSVKYIANIETESKILLLTFWVQSSMSYPFPWIQSSIQICQNWKVSAENGMQSILLVHQKCGKHCWKQQDRLQSIWQNFRSRTKTPEPPARTLRTFLAFFCLNTQYCIRLLHKNKWKANELHNNLAEINLFADSAPLFQPRDHFPACHTTLAE